MTSTTRSWETHVTQVASNVQVIHPDGLAGFLADLNRQVAIERDLAAFADALHDQAEDYAPDTQRLQDEAAQTFAAIAASDPEVSF